MMQIFSREQIRAWDEYTIANEPISSLQLMERAATSCYNWLIEHGYSRRSYSFFCSKGNNGGDGLAIARMLAVTGHSVKVFILEFGTKGTEEFQANLVLLHQTTAEIIFISTEETIAGIPPGDVVIDALLGTGVNRPAEGLTAALINHINRSGHEVISIDIPSGLHPDRSSGLSPIVKADQTLTFQTYKLAFLVPENGEYTGSVHLLNIGLHGGYPATVDTPFQTIDRLLAQQLLKPRKKFSHKGDYGHAALIAGSKEMMGAAVLSAKALVRSGAGKLTCHIPRAGYEIMQISVPEAMSHVEEGETFIRSVDTLEKYDAIAIGPGIGNHDTHPAMISSVLKANKRMVIDADALNTIAAFPELWKELTSGSIITPHPGEFARLFGKPANDFDAIEEAIKQASSRNICVVLKGANTFIATPSRKGYFNLTGNPGMAKGGSGDVLTGILGGLLAQGYDPVDAALLGVYVHGHAGDLAALRYSTQSMVASDIINHLGDAFNSISDFSSLIE